jgi:hypothetical protein
MVKKIFITLFILTLSLSFQGVQASGGFAVSGNFSNYHYKMVPGETISTPEVHIIFFNNYATEIEVALSPRVTQLDGSPSLMDDRLEFIVESLTVIIPAYENISVPVGIKLNENAPAGDYLIGLSAEIISKESDGITINGSAELRTQLSIFGEAGEVVIRTFDLFEEPILADLTLYRKEGFVLVPVRTSDNGLITDRVIPGDYVIIGIMNGIEVVHESFQVMDQTFTSLDLLAQSIFIENMKLTPILSENTDLLSRLRIEYTLRNIHTTVEDIRLVLVTLYEGEVIQKTEESTIPFLPECLFESGFNSLPEDGWLVGTYTFKIEAYVGDYLLEDPLFLGESRERDFLVPSSYVNLENPNALDLLEEDMNPFLKWGLIGSALFVIITASVLGVVIKVKDLK